MKSSVYKRLLLLLFMIAALSGVYYVWAARDDKQDGFDKESAAIFYAQEDKELLPDLVPLPARDLEIKKTDDGRTFLLFSTTYFNQGSGALELRGDGEGDEKKNGVERKVLQRIYRSDGGYRDMEVGTFSWHEEHTHYHFSTFIEYDLEPVDAPNHVDLSGSRVKGTFCVRDVSRVDLELANRALEAAYKVCDDDLQGVSVGWGDTYYYTYPNQSIDISSLRTGTYRMKFFVNPHSRLQELSYDNNTSGAFFSLDMEKGTVKVMDETPKDLPNVEHVHLKIPFGIEPKP